MSTIRKFIEGCLLDSAVEIGRERKRGLTITAKERNNMATSADFASEKKIIGRIQKSHPDSIVLSEESHLEADLMAESLFVVDPIDGTHNFIQNIPLYGISIAHFSLGKPTAGGIYLVPQKELYYAEKGKRPTLNGRGISVSKIRRLEDFFLMCDSRLHTIEDQGFMKGIIALERMSQHTRFIGSAIYDMGYVACGIADAALHFKLKPYDFAAAAFIVERAGGKVTDFEGRAWSLTTQQFLASNGLQHKEILEALKSKQD
ncbi:TPA: inositol monophosphatase [Candidatus Micrarchaeota archaeon]|nr:inositol monophosphatase [Candidatus Micrarchaeota archaeon]HIH30858.1 inositol monophosphatase [Candidatus Micrarchaeota archaeon]